MASAQRTTDAASCRSRGQPSAVRSASVTQESAENSSNALVISGPSDSVMSAICGASEAKPPLQRCALVSPTLAVRSIRRCRSVQREPRNSGRASATFRAAAMSAGSSVWPASARMPSQSCLRAGKFLISRNAACHADSRRRSGLSVGLSASGTARVRRNARPSSPIQLNARCSERGSFQNGSENGSLSSARALRRSANGVKPIGCRRIISAGAGLSPSRASWAAGSVCCNTCVVSCVMSVRSSGLAPAPR